MAAWIFFTQFRQCSFAVVPRLQIGIQPWVFRFRGTQLEKNEVIRKMHPSQHSAPALHGHTLTPIFQNGIRTVPDSNELPDNAELWRYMSISAFLMLLRGKVFVPTIEELRRSDPLEATSRCSSTHAYFRDIAGADFEWLHDHANQHEQAVLNNSPKGSDQKVEILIKVWDRELAIRRTVWCWHRSNIESMALWHVYGKSGVAIKTTASKLKTAFEAAYVDTALIAPVEYGSGGVKDLPHLFMRPYLLKQACYKHENEVRLVFPRASDRTEGGRLMSIKPRKLICEVRISPDIPRSEAIEVRRTLIQAWITGAKWNEKNEDFAVFPSDAMTPSGSEFENWKLDQIQQCGSTRFGNLKMPFVMCGDFRA